MVGAVLVILGYIGVSGADTEVLQLPYLASGRIGGLAAVAVGSALLVSADVRHDRERLGRIEGSSWSFRTSSVPSEARGARRAEG